MSELAHRLDVDLSQALEIAALVRAPGVTITSAARLIEAYAGAKGSAAALDAVSVMGDRISVAVEAPLARIDDRAYGEWCRKPEACRGKGYCPLDPTCGD